jgi:hypothetical protein
MFSAGFVIASTRFKTGYEYTHAFEAAPFGSTSKPLDGFTSLAASKPSGKRCNFIEKARNCSSTEEITISSCPNSLLTQCNEMNATLTSYFVYFIDLLRELLALDLNLRCGW